MGQHILITGRHSREARPITPTSPQGWREVGLAKYVGSRYDSYGNVNGKLLQLTYNNKVTDSLAGKPLAEVWAVVYSKSWVRFPLSTLSRA